ncbi:transglutaminase-like putative cysteine protease [Plasticicumulans lactativorans]|uniref:Transglutaminase-like putative cysteine protease n=1 Tax=Plasticicumulans lactativorans TaxID=1133106 RepID=A0A4R2LJU4_9GAMM|nr:DUF3488 and DUF4129 domain-containing transglutaminase family protein [Plasticicumulans lactativorans]TCO79645.1 transglutaminase-like putative cysteine protease [Plasticicumulans lactativorans]
MAERAVPAAQVYGLVGALAFAAAAHGAVLPPWLLAGVVAAFAWRLAVAGGHLRLPGRLVLGALTLAFGIAIALVYGTLLGRDAGVALLAGMSALKLLEWRTRRDALVLVFLGYLLVMARLLYDQGPLTALWLLLACVLLLAAHLACAFETASPPPRVLLGRAVRLLVRGVPLALLLFLLFPRIQGPLWGFQDESRARTGLSDEMTPGSIAELARSGEVAFRVRFDGAPPPPAARYWRGPVLDGYDGRSWRTVGWAEGLRRDAVLGEAPVRYVVTLEPHGRRWLFALDLPAAAPADATLGSRFVLSRRIAVNEVLRYEQQSWLAYRTAAPEAGMLRLQRQLPPGGNPRARALAAEWRALPDPAARVRAALQLFAGEPFRYTLSPPPLTGEPVDAFLFDTRAGFCEHYAGAFVYLMRAADVPARVVTGYLGGEAAPGGEYFIVRQSDAHAWAEVWLPERGWTRVDPTAAIAPERVENGAYGALDEPGELPLLARRDGGWVRATLLELDALANAWNDWVLAYGPERQRELLARLGWPDIDWRGLMLLLVALGGGGAAAAATWAAWRGWRRRDPRVALWNAACARLAEVGLRRGAQEGPLAFAARVAGARPELADEFSAIARLYAALRYGAGADAAALAELRRRTRAFHPRRTP